MNVFSFNSSNAPGAQQNGGGGFSSTLSQQQNTSTLFAEPGISRFTPVSRPTLSPPPLVPTAPAPAPVAAPAPAPVAAPAPAPVAAPAPAPVAAPITQTGTSADDVIQGGPGNDVLSGGAGDDVIDGGAGTDTIDTGTGFDIVRGGEGRDRITVRESGFIDAGGPNNDIVNIVGNPSDFQRSEFGNGVVVFSGNDGRVVILKDAEAVLFIPDVDSSFGVPFEPELLR